MPATPVCSYTTVALLYIRVPDLGSITTLTSAHLATFIGATEAEINGAIAQKYALPMTADYPVLTTLATELACYKVLSQRVFNAERLAASPWPDRYREASDKLARLAEGETLLVSTSGEVLNGRTDIAETFSTTMNYLPTMHEGPTPYQIQDQDKIDDLLDARDLDTLRDQLK